MTTNWRHQAACRDADPETFFPIDETKPNGPRVTAAKAICSGCPVRAQCLDYALGSGQRWGIWGGLTTPERRAELRARRHAA